MVIPEPVTAQQAKESASFILDAIGEIKGSYRTERYAKGEFERLFKLQIEVQKHLAAQGQQSASHYTIVDNIEEDYESIHQIEQMEKTWVTDLSPEELDFFVDESEVEESNSQEMTQ